MSKASEIFDTHRHSLDIFEKKNMFGWQCFFIKGNMVAGYKQDSFMLRLAKKDREAFLNLPNTSLFNPKGNRPMKEYVAVPFDILENKAGFRLWLDKAVNYAESLAPKPKK